jgi:hypothetical protein
VSNAPCLSTGMARKLEKLGQELVAQIEQAWARKDLAQ